MHMTGRMYILHVWQFCNCHAVDTNKVHALQTFRGVGFVKRIPFRDRQPVRDTRCKTYFLFLQEQIKGIIIRSWTTMNKYIHTTGILLQMQRFGNVVCLKRKMQKFQL